MCTVYHCVVISVWTVCDVYSVSLCGDISVNGASVFITCCNLSTICIMQITRLHLRTFIAF